MRSICLKYIERTQLKLQVSAGEHRAGSKSLSFRAVTFNTSQSPRKKTLDVLSKSVASTSAVLYPLAIIRAHGCEVLFVPSFYDIEKSESRSQYFLNLRMHFPFRQLLRLPVETVRRTLRLTVISYKNNIRSYSAMFCAFSFHGN